MSYWQMIDRIFENAMYVRTLTDKYHTSADVLDSLLQQEAAFMAVGMTEDEIRIIQRTFAQGKLDVKKLKEEL